MVGDIKFETTTIQVPITVPMTCVWTMMLPGYRLLEVVGSPASPAAPAKLAMTSPALYPAAGTNVIDEVASVGADLYNTKSLTVTDLLNSLRRWFRLVQIPVVGTRTCM